MPGLLDRVGRFARSPQGKRLMQRAQRMTRDPKTRRKIADARARFARR